MDIIIALVSFGFGIVVGGMGAYIYIDQCGKK